MSISVPDFKARRGDRVIFIYDDKRGTRRSGVISMVETHWGFGDEMVPSHSYRVRIDGKQTFRWLSDDKIIDVVPATLGSTGYAS